MDNFYITLPSNVQSFFTENTIANYKTKLASRLILSGDWEVALVEISYTLSWYNSPTEEEISLIIYENGVGKRYKNALFCPAGRYDTIYDYTKLINDKLVQFNDIEFQIYPQITVEDRDRLVTIKQGVSDNKLVFVELSDNLCQILGFEKKKLIEKYGEQIIKYAQIQTENIKSGIDPNTFVEPTEKERELKAGKPYELSGGYHSLFVYSNIVSPSFVGDSYTQLLRMIEIPTDATYGKQVQINYANTYYIPVLIKDFDTIEIDIKDDSGNSIPFEFGRSVVVLHFRKVNKKILSF